MNRIWNILMLSLFGLIAGPSWAEGTTSSPEQLFEEGNMLYKEENFQGALEKYQLILDAEKASAELHFNMGNAFFKINEIPSAILHYEKARKYNPEDEDIIKNLRMANLETVDKIEAKPEFALTNWWKSLLSSRSIDQWGYLTILLALIATGLWVVYLFANGFLKKVFFFTGAFVVLLSLVIFFMGMQQKSTQMNNKYAIVFAPSITVKSEPDSDGTKLFVIHEGTKVQLIETIDGWSKISLMNGNKGWIKSEQLEAI